MNKLRLLNWIKEFPLILGREFSGVVKAKGRRVRRNIKVGDTVFGISPAHQPGALAEYVVVDQDNVRQSESLSPEAENFQVTKKKLNSEIFQCLGSTQTAKYRRRRRSWHNVCWFNSLVEFLSVWICWWFIWSIHIKRFAINAFN